MTGSPPARGCVSCVLLADVLVSNLFILSNNFKRVKSPVRVGAAVTVMMWLCCDTGLPPKADVQVFMVVGDEGFFMDEIEMKVSDSGT